METPADSERSPSSSVVAWNLGGYLGTLVTFTPQAGANGQGDVTAVAPKPTCPVQVAILLDVSGSMGQYVGRMACQHLPDVLDATLPDAKSAVINLITFHSVSQGFKGTTAKFRADKARMIAQGSTVMAPGIKLLTDTVEGMPDNAPVLIIVISDGMLDDQEAAVAMSVKCAPVFQKRSSSIGVCTFRLMTSSHAQPDTRGLAAMGTFSNMGNVPVVDIPTSLSCPTLSKEDEAGTIQALLRSAIGQQMDQLGCDVVTVTAPVPCLRRLPTDTPKTELTFPQRPRKCAFLIDFGVVLSSVQVDGVPLSVSQTRTDVTESDLGPLLDLVETHLKLWKVTGAADTAAKIECVQKWCVAVQQRLETIMSDFNVKSGGASGGDGGSNGELMRIPTPARVRVVLDRIKARSKGVLQALLQLANQSGVSKLNSAQQAAFLRGDVKSTRTAKRALAKDAEADYDSVARDGIQGLKRIARTGDSEPEAATSFLSMDTWDDIYSATSVLAENAADANAGDILLICGGIGVPFRAPRGDLPDPWQFHVFDVFTGMYLSECDVHAAAATETDSSAKVKFPGRGRDESADITGVVPLRSLDPESYDKYNGGKLAAVAELHASACMRGVLARLPSDRLARDCAVLLCLVRSRDWAHAPLECDTSVFHALSAQISRAFETFAAPAIADVAKGLCEQADPRVVLTGDNDISGITKPLALLMCAPQCEAVRNDVGKLRACLAAVYGLAAYQAAKRCVAVEDRNGIIHTLLGINPDLIHAGNPGEADVPLEEMDVDPGFLASRVSLSWLPLTTDYARYAWACGNPSGNPFDSDPGVASIQQLAAAVHALKCKHETDRVDKSSETRVATGPCIHEGFGACATYIVSVVEAEYTAVYNAKLNKKHEAEFAIKRAEVIQQCLATNDVAGVFLPLLCATFPNRMATDYEVLFAKLLSTTGESMTPGVVEKLSVLITGRLIDGDGEAVWANGNVVPRQEFIVKVKPALEAVGNAFPSQAAPLARLIELYEQHAGASHVYRASGKPNRCGHSNIKPSFWAMGFQSLEAFRAAVPQETWEAYVRVHVKCCGL